MTSYIVTEGDFDAELITTVMRELLPEQQVVVAPAGGRSTAVSLARSLLVTRNSPVLLAMDADTVDARAIVERRQDLEALMRMAAGSNPWKLVLFVPEIEITLLSDVPFAERLLDTKLTSEQKVLVQYDPKRVLREVSQARWPSENGTYVLQRLSRMDLTPIRSVPGIREILDFLSPANQRSAA